MSKIPVMKFQHVYYSNGFTISAALSSDGKTHRPKQTHACMQHGYWCEKQIKEEGLSIIVTYLKKGGVKNPKTLIKAIKKYD